MAKKKNPAITITSWDDVDNALREIAEGQVAVAKIEGDLTVAVNILKEEAKQKGQPTKDRIKDTTMAIKAFCDNRKSEFSKKRSKELNFGKVGYHLTNSVTLPRAKEKIKALVKALKSFSCSECIATEEKPDREKIKDLDDGTLAKLGLTRKVDDSFRIEANLEKVQATA